MGTPKETFQGLKDGSSQLFSFIPFLSGVPQACSQAEEHPCYSRPTHCTQEGLHTCVKTSFSLHSVFHLLSTFCLGALRLSAVACLSRARARPCPHMFRRPPFKHPTLGQISSNRAKPELLTGITRTPSATFSMWYVLSKWRPQRQCLAPKQARSLFFSCSR